MITQLKLLLFVIITSNMKFQILYKQHKVFNLKYKRLSNDFIPTRVILVVFMFHLRIYIKNRRQSQRRHFDENFI